MSGEDVPAVADLNLNGDGKEDKAHAPPRDSKGWDGKLRVEKPAERNAILANPEALSDPEYSDEENVVPGEEIDADEGEFALRLDS
jgi:protein phosphatase 1 regulatory subunit 7